MNAFRQASHAYGAAIGIVLLLVSAAAQAQQSGGSEGGALGPGRTISLLPPPPTCNVAACTARWDSFREADCTYQPPDGPRRYCVETALEDDNRPPEPSIDPAEAQTPSAPEGPARPADPSQPSEPAPALSPDVSSSPTATTAPEISTSAPRSGPPAAPRAPSGPIAPSSLDAAPDLSGLQSAPTPPQIGSAVPEAPSPSGAPEIVGIDDARTGIETAADEQDLLAEIMAWVSALAASPLALFAGGALLLGFVAAGLRIALRRPPEPLTVKTFKVRAIADFGRQTVTGGLRRGAVGEPVPIEDMTFPPPEGHI